MGGAGIIAKSAGFFIVNPLTIKQHQSKTLFLQGLSIKVCSYSVHTFDELA